MALRIREPGWGQLSLTSPSGRGGYCPVKRSTRMELARQTVEIVERGSYQSAGGRAIDIAASVRKCLDATRFFLPEGLERLRQEVLARPDKGFATAFEVVNETT